jgi:GR25 family glycosyltransferase involved in LPS biosynthesis
MNQWLTPSEVACFLSHVSVWAKCVELDKPIIVLEHDAIVIKPYKTHKAYNCIAYLGCKYQLERNDTRMIYGQLNPNYRFMYCAHAYAIDPYVAKNMLSQVIKYGITTSLDAFIRGDIFSILQDDIYAYDEGPVSTIQHPTFNNHEENERKYLNCFSS